MMKTLFSRRAACSEGTALVVVAALLISLIVTKRSESYMNPVLVPFVVATATVFLFWGFSRILRATLTRTRSYAAAATLGMIAVLLVGPAVFGILCLNLPPIDWNKMKAVKSRLSALILNIYKATVLTIINAKWLSVRIIGIPQYLN